MRFYSLAPDHDRITPAGAPDGGRDNVCAATRLPSLAAYTCRPRSARLTMRDCKGRSHGVSTDKAGCVTGHPDTSRPCFVSILRDSSGSFWLYITRCDTCVYVCVHTENKERRTIARLSIFVCPSCYRESINSTSLGHVSLAAALAAARPLTPFSISMYWMMLRCRCVRCSFVIIDTLRRN